MASGENLTGLEQFRPLLAAGAVDVVQTDAVWGITHFLRVAGLAHAHDLPVSPVGNIPVGLLHAATATPNHIASELEDLESPVGVFVDLHVDEGKFVLGVSAGLGIRVDEDLIRASARRPGAANGGGPNVRPESAGRRLFAETDGARYPFEEHEALPRLTGI